MKIIQTDITPYGKIHMLQPARQETQEDKDRLNRLLARIMVKRLIRNNTR